MTDEERANTCTAEVNAVLQKWGCLINLNHNFENMNSAGFVEYRVRVIPKIISLPNWIPVDSPFGEFLNNDEST